ncbi:hypothetical protein GGX14DRAFT_563393 [Mycena pura]|uniref:Uncharacterized protein n=1 Tax=Mycena pura TaxID=153505 RepID=A0AAD6VJF4_9AGAR|nr:hypothetical protein GGX14DRAFT_563393 [Mycena pura]
MHPLLATSPRHPLPLPACHPLCVCSACCLPPKPVAPTACLPQLATCHPASHRPLPAPASSKSKAHARAHHTLPVSPHTARVARYLPPAVHHSVPAARCRALAAGHWLQPSVRCPVLRVAPLIAVTHRMATLLAPPVSSRLSLAGQADARAGIEHPAVAHVVRHPCRLSLAGQASARTSVEQLHCLPHGRPPHATSYHWPPAASARVACCYARRLPTTTLGRTPSHLHYLSMGRKPLDPETKTLNRQAARKRYEQKNLEKRREQAKLRMQQCVFQVLSISMYHSLISTTRHRAAIKNSDPTAILAYQKSACKAAAKYPCHSGFPLLTVSMLAIASKFKQPMENNGRISTAHIYPSTPKRKPVRMVAQYPNFRTRVRRPQVLAESPQNHKHIGRSLSDIQAADSEDDNEASDDSGEEEKDSEDSDGMFLSRIRPDDPFAACPKFRVSRLDANYHVTTADSFSPALRYLLNHYVLYSMDMPNSPPSSSDEKPPAEVCPTDQPSRPRDVIVSTDEVSAEFEKYTQAVDYGQQHCGQPTPRLSSADPAERSTHPKT